MLMVLQRLVPQRRSIGRLRIIRLLVALLLPMWPSASARADGTQGAQSQTRLILVLEFNNKLPKPERSTVDRGYLADRVLCMARSSLPAFTTQARNVSSSGTAPAGSSFG